MTNLRHIVPDYRLTTAEIHYWRPDHPTLLQQYVWQELDIAPEFPILSRFLRFWERELDGRLHTVRVASAALRTPADFTWVEDELRLH